MSDQPRTPCEGKDAKGRFAPGHKFSPLVKTPDAHAPTKRLSGRHWMRRALEIPEEQWPEVAFCAADRNARKLVRELSKLKGKDYVTALATAHQDAYGQEARLEVAPAPDIGTASAEIARIEAEINRLLRGGK